jgi:hypothetical protein
MISFWISVVPPKIDSRSCPPGLGPPTGSVRFRGALADAGPPFVLALKPCRGTGAYGGGFPSLQPNPAWGSRPGRGRPAEIDNSEC